MTDKTATIGDAILLYGTEEAVLPPVILRAGRLSAEFEAGNIRHIRVGGIEIIRAVSFIVRDRHWGTYDPTLTGLTIDQTAEGFTLRYTAKAKDDGQSFLYSALITGRSDAVTFRARGDTAEGFETNRTGFVVLHPASLAGAPVEIEHVDGRRVHGRFPDLIDPLQPMFDLRALTHEAATGLRVTCRMEGDTFEMEDQRNWCDASYKTYVRPLSRPWPYRLGAGEPLEQTVSVTISGMASREKPVQEAVRVSIGPKIGIAPAVGLGFDPSEAEPTRRVLTRLADLCPQSLVCHFDPRRGHARGELETAASVAASLQAEPWLEAVVVAVEGFEAEIDALAGLVRSLGSPFRAVTLSPAADLKSTPPGQPWPKAPPADAFYRAARAHFPDVRLGGGMLSTFTELNRKRPPLDGLDFVSFTTMALVHAADDVSVIEGLEALPAIARSARAIARHLPIVVGPSAIGLRHNPYGADPAPNPHNRRRAMALNDPRQRALLGAAWAVGYYAHLARSGAEAIVFGGTTGPFGVVHTKQDWPTPGYAAEGSVYPIFHALRNLARLSGRTLRALDISEPGIIEGVAAEAPGRIDLVLANLTAVPQRVWLDAAVKSIRILDGSTFEPGAAIADDGDADGSSAPQSSLILEPYALAFVGC